MTTERCVQWPESTARVSASPRALKLAASARGDSHPEIRLTTLLYRRKCNATPLYSRKSIQITYAYYRTMHAYNIMRGNAQGIHSLYMFWIDLKILLMTIIIANIQYIRQVSAVLGELLVWYQKRYYIYSIVKLYCTYISFFHCFFLV